MRRIFAILLLVTFTTANSGIAVSLHYCKGKFSKVEMGGGNTCCCKVKTMPKGCCTSRVVVIKVKSEFNKSNVEQRVPQIPTPVYHSFIFDNSTSDCLSVKYAIFEPLHYCSDHVVLNKAFRI